MQLRSVFGVCRFYCKMVKGYEWNYVEELVSGKTSSKLKCRSCGHQFSGNAHRIKEHVFKIPGNVSACKNPPRGIEEKFPEWALRVKRLQNDGKRKGSPKMMCPPSASTMEMMHDEEETPIGV